MLRPIESFKDSKASTPEPCKSAQLDVLSTRLGLVLKYLIADSHIGPSAPS